MRRIGLFILYIFHVYHIYFLHLIFIQRIYDLFYERVWLAGWLAG